MKNISYLWPNLARIVEIAKTGGFTVSVFFDSIDYPNGFDDYNSIKTYYKGWFDGFVENGDLKIEIIRPKSYDTSHTTGLSLADISKRIEKSLKNPKPKTELSENCKTLLNTATTRLKLSLSQIDIIKKIAAIIAQIDGKQNIWTEHVAEGIQCSYVFLDTAINAEAGAQMFGDKIQIMPGSIDSDLVQMAIDYLNTLLK